MNEQSKYIPNNEELVRLFAEGSDLGELTGHTKIVQWVLMMMLAEIGSAYYTLQDKLVETGALSEEDLADMRSASTDPQYLQHLYMHLAKVFQEKCERVAFAVAHPDKITEFVEKKNAGENPVDPMTGEGEGG